MFEPGTHKVRVANHQFVASENGPKQFSIYFEDEFGDHGAWYTALGWLKDGTFSMPAYEYAANQVAALGWLDSDHGMRWEELDGTGVLVGRECEIVVKPDTWQGVTKNKIAFINDPSRPRAGIERMDPSASMSFGESIRAALRQNGKQVPVTRQAAPKPSAPPAARQPINQPYDANSDTPF